MTSAKCRPFFSGLNVLSGNTFEARDIAWQLLEAHACQNVDCLFIVYLFHGVCATVNLGPVSIWRLSSGIVISIIKIRWTGEYS